jgi:alkanesulfonate monooxygenase SsuD/methylene tetrahydromethanopterin reductase-like flavin-dependent oxidoreductase (luciferase family)
VSGPWLGLFLPQLRMPFATILERTLAAEAAGFDSVWLMDHLAAPMAPEHDTLEGWTLAAALAARTSTIRIGHLVTCDPFRHPALLAKMAATVDAVSGGRLELGLGWGSVDAELATFGIGEGTRRERAARLAESIAILDLMFAGEPFDFSGEHFRLAGAIGRPRPVQQPRPPLHLGGGGARLTMPLVRQHADWWNCPSYAVDRLDELRPLAGPARVSVQHPVALAPSDAARAETLATGARRFGSWGGLVGGTAPEVADALAAEVDRGVEGFVVQLTDFGAPATIEHFMAAVAPALG